MYFSGSIQSKGAGDIHAEMEAVSQVLRRWRRVVNTNTALPLSGRTRKTPSSIGGGNFAASGPLPKKKDKVSGKKLKNESQRQRINRHNNAVGLQVQYAYLIKRSIGLPFVYLLEDADLEREIPPFLEFP